MDSNAPNCCSICEETYNAEGNCPRILSCSHCFCEQCLWKLIRNNTKNCPLCRKTFKANSPQDIPMNRTVLELMKYVEELERSFRSPMEGKGSPSSNSIKLFRDENRETSEINFTNYKRNKSEVEKDIKRNSKIKVELLQARKKIREEVAPKLNEIEMKIEKLIRQIEDENARLKSQLQEIMTQEKLIKDLGVKLDSTLKIRVAAPLMEEAEEANKKMKSKLEELEKYLAKQEQLQLHIGKEVKKTEKKILMIQEVLELIEKEDEEGQELSTIMGAMAISNEGVSRDRITIDVLRRMLKTNRIYALHEYDGVHQYARISSTKKGRKLLLHHLKEENGPFPFDTKYVQFNDVKELTEESRIFLQLGIDEGSNIRSLGKIFIRLISDSNLGLNFTFLCTGEKGHSYINTNLLDVSNKGDDLELVYLGDYETNDGYGGKGLVPGVDWEEEYYRDIHRRAQWIKGMIQGSGGSDELDTVCDESDASLFYILTRDSPGDIDMYGIFGEVEEGLHILTEAISKYPNIRQVKIIDCGLVLSK